MSWKVMKFLFCFLLPLSLAYCPQCERNAQFMSLMNQQRTSSGNGNTDILSGLTNNKVAINQPMTSSYASNNNNGYGQWNENVNRATINSQNLETNVPVFSQNGYSTSPQTYNGQIGNRPIRVITAGAYGCCSNNYNPCCNTYGGGVRVINLNALTNGYNTVNSNGISNGYSYSEVSRNEPEWFKANAQRSTEGVLSNVPISTSFDNFQTAQLQQNIPYESYNNYNTLPTNRGFYADNIYNPSFSPS